MCIKIITLHIIIQCKCWSPHYGSAVSGTSSSTLLVFISLLTSFSCTSSSSALRIPKKYFSRKIHHVAVLNSSSPWLSLVAIHQPCSYSYLPCLYSYLRHHALPVHRLRPHLGSQPSLSHPSRRRSCLRRRILLQVNAGGDVHQAFSLHLTGLYLP